MMKRFIAILLGLLMLLSLACPASAQTARTNGAAFYNRTADASTMDSWETLFGPDVNHTTNVGTVWTDKTVTTTTPSGYNFNMANDDTNFMVTLSTLSATMSITGHETLPTDTVFVLDLSSSMYRLSNGTITAATVSQMVTAVNNAIHSLLTLNPLNRVGVVIYYGYGYIDKQSDESYYIPLLQLDSFQPLENHNYLITQAANQNLSSINVNANLRTRTPDDPDTTVNENIPVYQNYTVPTANSSVAGTYIQLGIEKAREMLLAAETKIPADAEFQAGATRIPILVLMSDGEPTATDNEWADVNTAVAGCNSIGERSPAESDFMTQLTAAYTRKLIDEHYAETTPLFYTLGLGTSVSYDVMDPKGTDDKYASLNANHANYKVRTKRASSTKHVNDPEIVNAKVKHYWEQLLNNGSVSFNVIQNNNGNTGVSDWVEELVTVSKHSGFPSNINDKYYVDKFFEAEGARDLANAFDNLIQEIILQSAYYPTYVENGAIGMSGYVDFHDEIGDMMEVKAVHGLARKANAREIENINNLPAEEKSKINFVDGIIYYKGEQIAQYFQQNMYSTTIAEDAEAEITRVLTALFHKRLGLTEANAALLLKQIVKNKAIYWKSNTDFSNAFTWYADSDEKFIALDVGQTAPDNARYRITSYWYASPYDLENTNSFIRIKTNLGSMRKQCVTWSVPASMIPLVTYQVTLTGDKLDENDSNITVAYKDNYPMRAFFEVGLRSDVNKYNAVEKLKELGYQANEGRYTFFSNKWDATKTDPDLSTIDNSDNTVSYFKPSEQNERYYVTTDSPLYVLQNGNYVEYSGDKPTNGNGFYVRVPKFTKKDNTSWGSDNNATLSWVYTALPNTTIDTVEVNSRWYADVRTVKNPGPSSIAKTENTTQSFPDSTYESQRDETYVTSILGNNGTFHFTADTGIEITKTVDRGENVPLTDKDKTAVFTFVIEPAEGSSINLNGTTYAINYHKDGAQIENSPTGITAVDGKITVQLHHGETAYIAGCVIKSSDLPGLPVGKYTITEQIVGEDGQFFYEVSDVTVARPGNTTPAFKGAANTVTVDVAQFEVTEIHYTNVPVQTGAIEISKTVTGDGAPANAAFTFEVQMDKDHHGGNTVKKSLNGGTETTITVPDDGKLEVSIKAGDKLRISGLAAGENVNVTVKETNLPAGFHVNGDVTKTLTVTSNNTAEFTFANIFEPAHATFSGAKFLENRSLTENDKFTFELYAATKAEDGTITVDNLLQTVQNSTDGKFAFEQITYTAPGAYHYVVKEAAGTLPGVTYDAQEHHIQVDVTATEVTNGTKLVATVASIPDTGLTFTNTYTPAATSVTLGGTKTLQNLTPDGSQFSFSLYAADQNFAVTGDALQTVFNDADGKFAFTPLSYSSITDDAKTHYYVVKENFSEATAIPGVDYDETIYQIEVSISYSQETGKFSASTTVTKVTPAAGNGEADTVTTGIGADALNFINRYDATEGGVKLSGVKTLMDVPTNEAIKLQGGEFSFGLYEAVADTEGNLTIKDPTAAPLQTKSNNADGTFSFDQLDYNAADTYYYIVKEMPGSLPGVTYDTKEYHVTVTVTDQGAALTPVVTVAFPVSTLAAVRPDPVIVPYNSLNFINYYDAEDTSVTFSGAKTLTGRPLNEGEFSFELYNDKNELIDSVTNAADDTFTFKEITYTTPGTYTYTVKELVPASALPGVTYDTTVYNIQVVVSDTADAKLVAAVTGIPEGGLVFNNTYDAVDTEAVFSGVKTLVGRPLQAGEFSFTLYSALPIAAEEGGGLQIGEAIQTVRNDADGTFSFPQPQHYDKAGTYYYIVKEDAGDLPGVTYDPTEYIITVTVEDINAVLTPTDTVVAVMPIMTLALTDAPVTLAVTDLNFTNYYDAEDTSVTFSGTKTLSGRRMKAGEFSFTLYLADGNYNPITALETVTNTADGAFAFAPIPYATEGTYYYLVREEQGPLADMTYDTTEYRIQVVVKDQSAQLVASATVTTLASLPAGMAVPTASTLAFHNAHDETDTAVRFSGTKALSGRSMSQGEFSFTLYSADTTFTPLTALQTVTNAADGAFAFRPIVFSRTGAYYFVVREDAGMMSGVSYDRAEYRIFVEVWNNNGVLVANITANRFLNGESTPVNPTGGLTFTNHYVPASATVPFSGLKRYQGAALQNGMFTFHLYAADEAFTPVGAPLESVVNAIDGSFTFTQRVFHTPGVYRFLMVEDASLPLPHVTYDPTVYQLTVTVTDDGMGSLAASTSITTGDGLAADLPVFENFYYEVPETGDPTSPITLLALCLMSLMALMTLVIFRRRCVRG